MTPETAIVGLNLCVIALAYLSVMPTLAGRNINKIMAVDVAASCVCLGIVASVYWGSEVTFGFFNFQLNWFWFTFITYAILEVPAALWYASKHKVSM